MNFEDERLELYSVGVCDDGTTTVGITVTDRDCNETHVGFTKQELQGLIELCEQAEIDYYGEDCE